MSVSQNIAQYIHEWRREVEPSAIVAEMVRRRTEARRLRSSAGAEWSAAKARFEQELLDKQ